MFERKQNINYLFNLQFKRYFPSTHHKHQGKHTAAAFVYRIVKFFLLHTIKSSLSGLNCSEHSRFASKYDKWLASPVSYITALCCESKRFTWRIVQFHFNSFAHSSFHSYHLVKINRQFRRLFCTGCLWTRYVACDGFQWCDDKNFNWNDYTHDDDWMHSKKWILKKSKYNNIIIIIQQCCNWQRIQMIIVLSSMTWICFYSLELATRFHVCVCGPSPFYSSNKTATYIFLLLNCRRNSQNVKHARLLFILKPLKHKQFNLPTCQPVLLMTSE